MKNFGNLISAIGDELGPTSGLDCEEVDHQRLVSLMESYTSNQAEWKSFALADLSRNYTRNLVADTNKKSNILVVVWNAGKGSPIHDHANAHCIMKILKGSLTETVYSHPENEHDKAPKPTRATTYRENQVTYISDKIGLHKVENSSNTEPAVSLHLYTPPHAHNYGFNIFDESSGKKLHIKSAPLHSERGRLCGNQRLPRTSQI